MGQVRMKKGGVSGLFESERILEGVKVMVRLGMVGFIDLVWLAECGLID